MRFLHAKPVPTSLEDAMVVKILCGERRAGPQRQPGLAEKVERAIVLDRIARLTFECREDCTHDAGVARVGRHDIADPEFSHVRFRDARFSHLSLLPAQALSS